MTQFADGTCIFYQNKFKNLPKVIEVLQETIDQISTWFARLNIKINANKTEAITFTKTRRELNAPIKIQNQVIPYSFSVKYLGLTLDSKLTFKDHVSKLKQKYHGALTILYPLFKSNTLTQRIKVTLYMTLIRSMLLSGYKVWSILAKCHKKKIRIFQNKCLKIIFEAPRYTRISELHDVANFPYIEELMEDRVHKMFHISTHDNPLVRSVGHFYQ